MLAEIYHLRPGPDGLTRITRRITGEGVAESWVTETARAEMEVLARWDAFARREVRRSALNDVGR